jgi:hypothetical protein
MNRPSTRLVLAGLVACLIGGSALSAAADEPSSGTKTGSGIDHTICLINQDSATGPQQGLCITLPLPLINGIIY